MCPLLFEKYLINNWADFIQLWRTVPQGECLPPTGFLKGRAVVIGQML